MPYEEGIPKRKSIAALIPDGRRIKTLKEGVFLLWKP